MTEIIGFSGSFSDPSKTRALVERATQWTAALCERRSAVLDLADLGQGLGAARKLSDLPPQARGTVDLLLGAEALVIGSPVYKGSYTGLFKHLFDLIEPDALKGKPVLLTATGGGPRHALVIEHQLRPLFGFFEAAIVATGVYAASDDFADGVPTAPAVLNRLAEAAAQLAAAVTNPAQAMARVLAHSAA
ncbi:MAG: NAD(P)H-dependent oxidoreductase [Pseudodonghicola sp.]